MGNVASCRCHKQQDHSEIDLNKDKEELLKNIENNNKLNINHQEEILNTGENRENDKNENTPFDFVKNENSKKIDYTDQSENNNRIPNNKETENIDFPKENEKSKNNFLKFI